MNSSPPTRHGRSDLRTPAARILPTSRSAKSPAACPSVSLTRLEVIEIHRDQDEATADRAGPVHEARELGVEAAAVVQPGQPVGPSGLLLLAEPVAGELELLDGVFQLGVPPTQVRDQVALGVDQERAGPLEQREDRPRVAREERLHARLVEHVEPRVGRGHDRHAAAVARVDERQLAEVAPGAVAAHLLAAIELGLGLALDEEEHGLTGLAFGEDLLVGGARAQRPGGQDRVRPRPR